MRGRLCLFVQEEKFVHMEAQQPSKLDGEGQSGIVFVVFNGNDGLAADPQHTGQIFLAQACRFA